MDPADVHLLAPEQPALGKSVHRLDVARQDDDPLGAAPPARQRAARLFDGVEARLDPGRHAERIELLLPLGPGEFIVDDDDAVGTQPRAPAHDDLPVDEPFIHAKEYDGHPPPIRWARIRSPPVPSRPASPRAGTAGAYGAVRNPAGAGGSPP